MIQRYAHSALANMSKSCMGFRRSDNGEWVRHDDHAAAITARDETIRVLREEVAAARMEVIRLTTLEGIGQIGADIVVLWCRCCGTQINVNRQKFESGDFDISRAAVDKAGAMGIPTNSPTS